MVMSGINKMLDGERPQYTKGEQIWDYLYNKDAARAFRLIAEKGQDNSIYCLGSGRTRMLKDYIYAIRDAIDPSIDIGVGELDYYPNQVMHLEADISNLTKDTGFTPQYSFEEGIRETIAWVKEQRNR
jgi:nucleoside-diphosphate-sugar epimerase